MTWTPTNQYWVGARPVETRRITTSAVELTHLLIASAVLTVAIAIVRSQILFASVPGTFTISEIVGGLWFGALATLSGFVAHEMAHKVTAQRYGFWSEFRFSPSGLLLSLVTSLFGFLFALPGATVVRGMGNTADWGKTSLAGPIVNLVEGTGFALLGAIGVAIGTPPIFFGSALLLAFFNGWFATFNLIPFGPLDGAKVWRWHRALWVGCFVTSAIFTAAVFWYLNVA